MKFRITAQARENMMAAPFTTPTLEIQAESSVQTLAPLHLTRTTSSRRNVIFAAVMRDMPKILDSLMLLLPSLKIDAKPISDPPPIKALDASADYVGSWKSRYIFLMWIFLKYILLFSSLNSSLIMSVSVRFLEGTRLLLLITSSHKQISEF